EEDPMPIAPNLGFVVVELVVQETPSRCLTASNCPVRHDGDGFYSMGNDIAGKCVFPLAA
ncbi:MAG TPA: hypothetical protein VJK02_01650, partial [Anaerolineales bacterium]|nr:hypothetical protein [Anaerolineales bacterium]